MRRTLISLAVAALAATGIAGIAAAPAHAATCGLTKDADGTYSPVVCANGKPNAKAKKHIRQATPTILKLQKTATSDQIVSAVCADIANRKATFPMVQDGLDYVAAQHAWQASTVSSVMNQLVNGKICA